MTEARHLRYLVVGCGSIGRRHARNLRALGAKDIVAYDPDPARMAEVEHECGARPCASLDEAYGGGVDAALICAPTSLHLPLARQALERDCHVFLEKPIAETSAGVDGLLRVVAERRRVLLVGYNLRFDPLVAELRRWLDQERVGHVLSARLHFGSYLPWRHPWEDYRVGYGARQALGGGVILDAIHELDYAQWLFGAPERVYCVAGRFGDLEIDVEDVAEIVLTYPSRVVSIHLDYMQRPHQRLCTIIGTRGQIQGDLVARTLRLFDGDRREWEEHVSACSADAVYEREIAHFLECIEGRARPAVDGGEAARSLATAEAAKRSAQLRIPVAVAGEPGEDGGA